MFCDDAAPNMETGEASYAKQVYVDGLLWFDRDEESDIPTPDVTPSWNSGFTGENPGTTFPSPSTWSEWSTSSEDYTSETVFSRLPETSTMASDPSPVPTNWGELYLT